MDEDDGGEEKGYEEVFRALRVEKSREKSKSKLNVEKVSFWVIVSIFFVIRSLSISLY